MTCPWWRGWCCWHFVCNRLVVSGVDGLHKEWVMDYRCCKCGQTEQRATDEDRCDWV